MITASLLRLLQEGSVSRVRRAFLSLCTATSNAAGCQSCPTEITPVTSQQDDRRPEIPLVTSVGAKEA